MQQPLMGNQGPGKIIEQELGFNQQQNNAYALLLNGHQATIRQLGDSIRQANYDLYQSLTTNNLEGKEVLINKLGQLQQQVERTNYDHFVAIKIFCTPAQLSSYHQLTKHLARFFDPSKKGLPPPKD